MNLFFTFSKLCFTFSKQDFEKEEKEEKEVMNIIKINPDYLAIIISPQNYQEFLILSLDSPHSGFIEHEDGPYVIYYSYVNFFKEFGINP